MSGSDYALEAHGLRKSYGGIAALKGVDFRVRPGSVHALVGENGAGKSTLVRLLVGATTPDSGTLYLNGEVVQFANTVDAATRGIAIVSQELNLFPDLDVLANLFPMREPRWGPVVSRKKMLAQARPVLKELGLAVDPYAPVELLSLEQRQLLEIARALMVQPQVLILDEPASALHVRETERLHAVLRALRQRGVAVIYISHLLEDVLNLCDEVTVLRDGKIVMDAASASQLKVEEIVYSMLGEKVSALPMFFAPGESEHTTSQALRLEHVTVPGQLEDVTLEVQAGTIVGVAGLSGSGHRDVLAVSAGLTPFSSGSVRLPNGNEIRSGLRAAIQQGVALVPGDRQRIGLMLDKPLWDNVVQVSTVALKRDGLFPKIRQLRARTQAHMRNLNINASSVNQEVGELSGGNQQKVVFAKWLDSSPSVLLLDDPTRGIDVGAKAEIYGLMRDLAGRGVVQILASTDPLELASICDRVFVFHSGHICATLDAPHFDAHTILEIMNTGEWR